MLLRIYTKPTTRCYINWVKADVKGLPVECDFNTRFYRQISSIVHKVFVKRLGSRGFDDLVNQYIIYFRKRYEYCKAGAHDICVNFSKFFNDDFHEYKMSVVLYNRTHSSTLTLS